MYASLIHNAPFIENFQGKLPLSVFVIEQTVLSTRQQLGTHWEVHNTHPVNTSMLCPAAPTSSWVVKYCHDPYLTKNSKWVQQVMVLTADRQTCGPSTWPAVIASGCNCWRHKKKHGTQPKWINEKLCFNILVPSSNAEFPFKEIVTPICGGLL